MHSLLFHLLSTQIYC